MTTNVVITPNQTWGHCPEDPESVPESRCEVTDSQTNLSRDPSFEDIFVSFATIPAYVAYRSD